MLRRLGLAAVLIACVAAVPRSERAMPCRAPLVGIIDTGADPTGLHGSIDRRSSVDLVDGGRPMDVEGHGTEMAWIVHEAAPGARLAIVRAVGADGTTDRRLAASLAHLRRAGASIVLMSLAGAEPLPRTRGAIEAAGTDGVVVFAAAGNDGLDLGRASSYPGGYRSPNLVTVAAVRSDGRLWGSSNRGGPVSMVAPAAAPTRTLGGEQVTSIGTSAAAARAAGAAARDACA